MQFKINKDTDTVALSKDMADQIMAALKEGLGDKIKDKEGDIVVDIFVNVRTTDLKDQ